jgi:hypothetical protein
MANEEKVVYQFSTRAGIQRDGTDLDANFFNDGQHVRFQRNRPKKMGGYKAISNALTGPIRAAYVWSRQTLNSIFCFSPTKIQMVYADSNAAGANLYDRTPVTRVLTMTAILSGTAPNLGNLVTGGTSTATGIVAKITGTSPALTLTICYMSTTPFTGGGEVLTFSSGGTTIGTATGSGYTSTAFATDTNYTWQVDSMYDAAANSNKTILIAHAAPSLTSIDNGTATPVYIGDISATAALESTGQTVSGGLVSCPPYLVLYGSDGLVQWSNANEPLNFSTGDAGTARATGAKIVKGLPVRGSGQAPSALFWSLDSVIKMNYIGGSAVFRFDPISSQSSILSSNSVIEYDGVFYWAGVDRFLAFTGAVKELPNTQNLNYFYDNLNYEQRQKVWAMKIPRYGEIWWFYPADGATECNRAVIFNVGLATWYDTALSRSSGYYSQVFRYPVMTGNTADPVTGFYTAWAHEYGHDMVTGEMQTAVQSYFETSDFGLPTGGPVNEALQGQNRWTRVTRVEPDFLQTGDMTCQVTGYEFAHGEYKVSAPYPFSPTTAKIDMREQRREVRLRFESNTVGGNFEMGKVLLHLEPGDVRS